MAVSEERNRLARDLHDSAKQEALAASFHLGTALTLFERDPQRAKNHLVEADNLVDSVRGELTDLIHELRPPSMNGDNFDETLNEYLIEWAHQTGIKATLKVTRFQRSISGNQASHLPHHAGSAGQCRPAQCCGAGCGYPPIWGSAVSNLLIADDGIGFDTRQTL